MNTTRSDELIARFRAQEFTALTRSSAAAQSARGNRPRVRASVRPQLGRPLHDDPQEACDPLAVIGRRLPQCGEESGIVMDPELGPHLL